MYQTSTIRSGDVVPGLVSKIDMAFVLQVFESVPDIQMDHFELNLESGEVVQLLRKMLSMVAEQMTQKQARQSDYLRLLLII
jgi:hypothetical protein